MKLHTQTYNFIKIIFFFHLIVEVFQKSQENTCATYLIKLQASARNFI